MSFTRGIMSEGSFGMNKYSYVHGQEDIYIVEKQPKT